MEKKKQIENIIKKNPEGLTIQQIVDKSGFSWNTVTKILAMIEGRGNLRIREVGRAKLHYLKGGSVAK